MPILNYTTKVDEHKTVGEIQEILSRQGASSVSVLYTSGHPDAVSFRFGVGGRDVPFKLPCKLEGVRKVMLSQVKTPQLRRRREKDPEFAKQVRRVAWRIVKDWVQAQLALIEAGQAELAEVFLPYVASSSGVTLYEAFRSEPGNLILALDGTRPRALPAPGEK